MLTELSLFTGAGGGVYASKLLGHRVVGYVEWNDYCQRVIAQRIDDGIFDSAPIFGDVRKFVREGYADAYRGLVDVVSGGFPCQPFSVAGSQLGVDDPRNMWPATRDVLDAVRPRFAFLENVPGLASNGYFGTILGDLSSLGYDAEWCVLGADDCGAPHIRKRLWILGVLPDAKHAGDGVTVQPEPEPGGGEATDTRSDGASRPLADADSQWQPQSEGPEPDERGRALDGGQEVVDTDSARLEERQGERCDDGEERTSTERAGVSSWWDGDPADGNAEAWGAVAGLDRVAHGVANRKHRLEAIGNGQVPIVAATAFKLLTGRIS